MKWFIKWRSTKENKKVQAVFVVCFDGTTYVLVELCERTNLFLPE